MTPVRYSNHEADTGNNSRSLSALGSSRWKSQSSRGLGPGNQRHRMSLFRSIFNRRNDDYRSDQPVAPTATSSRTIATPPAPAEYRKNRSNSGGGTFAGGAGTSASVASGDEDTPATRSRFQLCCSSISAYIKPSKASLDRLSALITSRVWQIMLFFFTILLLFGPEFQELWAPKDADIVFDVLYSVALGAFALDIIIRCYTEPQYFEFNLCGKTTGDALAAWGSCRLGSFMFWCDLLSSATLLFNISFVNATAFQMKTIGIELDRFGLPVRWNAQCRVSAPSEVR